MQTRMFPEFAFVPSGGGQTEPPRAFRLRFTMTPQSRRSNRESWRDDRSIGEPEVTELPLSRSQLAALISDGAEWLAYLGEET